MYVAAEGDCEDGEDDRHLSRLLLLLLLCLRLPLQTIGDSNELITAHPLFSSQQFSPCFVFDIFAIFEIRIQRRFLLFQHLVLGEVNPSILKVLILVNKSDKSDHPHQREPWCFVEVVNKVGAGAMPTLQ